MSLQTNQKFKDVCVALADAYFCLPGDLGALSVDNAIEKLAQRGAKAIEPRVIETLSIIDSMEEIASDWASFFLKNHAATHALPHNFAAASSAERVLQKGLESIGLWSGEDKDDRVIDAIVTSMSPPERAVYEMMDQPKVFTHFGITRELARGILADIRRRKATLARLVGAIAEFTHVRNPDLP
jgi:hypothetical protein